jgi:hypothetical protein
MNWIKRLHVLHGWPRMWTLVVRRDFQGGEFWAKECGVCGAFKTSITRPRWFPK